MSRPLQHSPRRIACCILLLALLGVDISPRIWQVYWQCSAIFKKYLQCVLAARILTVDFVVCTLAVKKKSGQISTCRIGPFPCKHRDSLNWMVILTSGTVTISCRYNFQNGTGCVYIYIHMCTYIYDHVYCLFNDAFRNSGYEALSDWMAMTKAVKLTWNLSDPKYILESSDDGV
jgi:hypothetical protein